jgi:hypothetical protein
MINQVELSALDVENRGITIIEPLSLSKPEPPCLATVGTRLVGVVGTIFRSSGLLAKIVSALVLLVGAQETNAIPFAYTFQGIASGSLGTTSFTNAPFTITMIADTDEIVQIIESCTPTPCTVLYVNDDSATVSVGDLTASITSSVRVFDNQTFQGLGLSRGGPRGNDLLDLGFYSEFATYNLATPFAIGPLFPTPHSLGDGFDCNNGCVTTNLGDLIIDSVQDVTFTANGGGSCVVPTGEMTKPHDWDPAKPAVFQWGLQTLQGGNFAGRLINEVDAGGAVDTCWFQDSRIPRVTGIPPNAPGWAANAQNQWGFDGVGWKKDVGLPDPIKYYRREGRAPCRFVVRQQMQISCPDGSFQNYGPVNKLIGEIGTTTVKSCRAGKCRRRDYP